jgi:hypothetical protein
MSIYETLWKDEKNRTLLIGSIVTIACIILAILFAMVDQRTAPEWIKGLYYDLNDPEPPYKVGLTIIEIILVSVLYFFLLISLATYSEIRAKLPSWGTILISVIITILFTWFITSLHPAGPALPTNFTSGMQWTIFGVIIAFMFLSVVYIFLTETPEEEKKKKKK